MKVLPLILTIIILMSLALREELRNFRTIREGNISSVEQMVNFRESRWADEGKKKEDSGNPKQPSETKSLQGFRGGVQKPRELNIYPLVDMEEFGKSPEQSQFLLRTVEKLLYKQFQGSPFFQTLVASDPQVVSHLFEAIREKISASDFKMGQMTWKDLATIKLDNDRLQILFYEVLKGEKMRGEKMDKAFEKGEDIPLMNALRVEKGNRPTRLFTASPTLLEVLVSDSKYFQPLLEKRRAIARELRKNKNKDAEGSTAKAALEKQWEEALKEAGIDLPKEQFSYEISTTRF